MKKPEFQTIGRFIVDSIIGAGGSGRVYKVRDPVNDDILALKITTVDEESENSSIIPRFRREFAVARKLDHPHLIRVYELGSMDKQLYYTMELINGTEFGIHLNQFKSRLSDIDPNDKRTLWLHILDLLIQASDALMYLHQHGLVHRDIKPGNLLVTTENVLKVTDFGTMRNKESFTQMTKTGSILGTVAYMSPEQTVTSKVDQRSDIYSLGLIAYESFTGSSPFDGPIMKQILTRSRQDVPDPRRRLPELPGAIAEVLNRMIKRRPEDRFSSARELNVQLQAAAEILTKLNSSRLISQTERPVLQLLDAPMIGYDSTLHLIHESLQNISVRPIPRIFLFQGGVGMGKTRLCVEGRTQAELIGRTMYGIPGAKTGFLKLGAEILKWDFAPKEMPETFPVDLFEALCKKPSLLILDNIHHQSHADQTAIVSFLKYLIQESLRQGDCPVVIIMTTCDHDPESREITRAIRRVLRNFDEFYHHRLKPFSREEIRKFISALLPGPLEIFDLPERLHAVTGGNPFHVEHCIRHLVTEGIISHVGAVWVAQLDASMGYRPLNRAETPLELIRYASEKLRQLNTQERKIVQLGALFPHRFTVSMLSDLLSESSESIARTIESILEKNIIQTTAGVDEGYTFTTPVLGSWALETFSSQNLDVKPETTQQMIDVFPQAPPVACRLAAAKLAQRMKRPDLAMKILMEYGEKWYIKGWISPSMTAWREAMSIQTDTDGTMVLKCSLGIGRCLRDIGYWRSSLAHFDELVHHSKRALQDSDSPNRALTQIHIIGIIELAETMRKLGMPVDAEKRMLEFLDITRQADLQYLHRHALAVRGRIRRDQNDLQFSEAIFQRLLHQLDPQKNRAEFNRLRLDLAVTKWKRGNYQDALSILESAMIDNMNPEDALLGCRLKIVVGDTSFSMGNHGDAEKHWTAAADIAEKEMFPLERCAALIRIASTGKNKSKEEPLLRVQSILHRLDLEETCLNRII